jgi:hypothetical protein
MSITTTSANLETASAFAILAATEINNNGYTRIMNGNIGLSPGDLICGLPSDRLSCGVKFIGKKDDYIVTKAQMDAAIAYGMGIGLTGSLQTETNLGGYTFGPGVFKFNSNVSLTGIFVLQGTGSGNDLFIIQIAGSFVTDPYSQITLTNSAQSCNVYWLIGSSAVLGNVSTFNGNIIAVESIIVGAGAKINGRLIALKGAVTLNHNEINTACSS